MGQEAGFMNHPQYRDRRAGIIDDTDDPNDPAVIEGEIEHTRAEMSATIDELADRLNPEHLKEAAKERVREATIGRAQDMANNATESVRQTGNSLMDTILQNPIPAAMAGVGIAWLWKNRSGHQNGHSRYGSQYAYQARPTGYGYPSYRSGRWPAGQWSSDQQDESWTGNVKDKAGQVTSGAKDQIGHVAEGAREQFGHVTEQAAHLGEGMMHQVDELGSGAQDQFQHLRQRYSQLMVDNPLTVGIAAVGLGLATGLLIPETEREDRLLGETRDNFVERAQSTARETLEKVEHVAEDVTQTVRETAGESARQEGLTQ